MAASDMQTHDRDSGAPGAVRKRPPLPWIVLSDLRHFPGLRMLVFDPCNALGFQSQGT